MIRGTFALAFVMAVGCGDDSGSDSSGSGDGGSLTLQDALKTSGTNTSDDRAQLLFNASCMNEMACSGEAVASCVSEELAMYKAGQAAGFSDTCLDTTLDSYACFVNNTNCTTWDTVCNDSSAAAIAACAKYEGDAGL